MVLTFLLHGCFRQTDNLIHDAIAKTITTQSLSKSIAPKQPQKLFLHGAFSPEPSNCHLKFNVPIVPVVLSTKWLIWIAVADIMGNLFSIIEPSGKQPHQKDSENYGILFNRDSVPFILHLLASRVIQIGISADDFLVNIESLFLIMVIFLIIVHFLIIVSFLIIVIFNSDF
jgi:hypothetical protein